MKCTSGVFLVVMATLSGCATSTPEDNYIAALGKANIKMDTAAHRASAIDTGKAICAGLDKGNSIETTESVMIELDPSLEAGVKVLVGAAVINLCPKYESDWVTYQNSK